MQLAARMEASKQANDKQHGAWTCPSAGGSDTTRAAKAGQEPHSTTPGAHC